MDNDNDTVVRLAIVGVAAILAWQGWWFAHLLAFLLAIGALNGKW